MISIGHSIGIYIWKHINVHIPPCPCPRTWIEVVLYLNLLIFSFGHFLERLGELYKVVNIQPEYDKNYSKLTTTKKEEKSHLRTYLSALSKVSFTSTSLSVKFGMVESASSCQARS